jgi:hypothetical protein
MKSEKWKMENEKWRLFNSEGKSQNPAHLK